MEPVEERSSRCDDCADAIHGADAVTTQCRLRSLEFPVRSPEFRATFTGHRLLSRCIQPAPAPCVRVSFLSWIENPSLSWSFRLRCCCYGLCWSTAFFHP